MTSDYWQGRAGSKLRRRAFLGSAGAAAAGSAALLLVGCGDDDDGDATASPDGAQTPSPDGSPTPESQSVTRGGTVQAGLTSLSHLDPHLVSSGTGPWYTASVYSTLTLARFPVDGEASVDPELADEWEQPDDMTWKFSLAPNIKWQDVDPTNGRAFTSEDVKLAFERMLNPNLTPEPSGLVGYDGLFIDRIETPDDQTVVFRLKRPFGLFPLLVGDSFHGIVPRELFDDALAKQKAVGTGAFIIDKYQVDVGMSLRANPDYFRPGLPYLDRIEIPIIGDATQLTNEFLSGKNAYQQFPFALKSEVESAVKGVQWVEAPAGPLNIEINTTRPPFDNVMVRQALLYATDWKLVRDVGYQGHGNFPPQPLGSMLKKYQLPESELPQRDVKKAKELLSAAGYPNGIEFTNKSIFTGDDGPEQVRTSLAEAGITMKHELMDFAQWRATVYAQGNMDVTVTRSFVFGDPGKQLWIKFHSTGANNNMHYNDPTYDQLWADAVGELDEKEAIEKYRAATRRLLDQVPSVPGVESIGLVGLQPWLRGWKPDIGYGTQASHFKQYSKMWRESS